MDRNLESLNINDCIVDIESLPTPLTKEYVLQVYMNYRDAINNYFIVIIGENEEKVIHDNLSEHEFMCELICFLNKYFNIMVKDLVTDITITLADIYSPTLKRTKVRFKMFNNFLHFLQEQRDRVAGVIMAKRNEVEGRCSLVMEKERLKNQMASLAEAIARNEDELVKVQRLNDEAEKSYLHLQEQQEDKEQNCKKLQQDLKILIDTYESKQKLVKNLKTNISYLNGQLVTKDNYNSLSDLTKNLKAKYDKLETDCLNNENCLSNKVGDLDNFKGIYKTIENLSMVSRELQAEKETFNNIKGKQEGVEDQYKGTVKEIETKMAEIFKIKSCAKERSIYQQSVKLKLYSLLQEIHNEVEQINNDLKEERKIQVQLEKEDVSLKRERFKLEKLLEEEEEKIIDLKHFYSGMYSRIIQAENSVTATMNEKLESIVKTVL